MSAAYYNEIDPYAAQWLRNLIERKLIAAGDVDERSILEVKPDDLRNYTQCHFFAGIGGWSHALRLAGWPDDRPVWTGSCPCQPFSAAGKQRGSDDERHLWPAFFSLIRQCRPGSVFGEQVAGAAGLAWLDHVCADLEGAEYAAAAANLCAAGAGAFHIRQRLYWVAQSHEGQRGKRRATPGRAHGAQPESAGSGASGVILDDAIGARLERYARNDGPERRKGPAGPASATSVFGELAHGVSIGRGAGRDDDAEHDRRFLDAGSGVIELADPEAGGQRIDGRAPGCAGHAAQRDPAGGMADADGGDASAEREQCRGEQRQQPDHGGAGAWADVEWIKCSDGKARATQPGLFPLAHGVSNRVGRLRAYGNAIVPQVAAAFVLATATQRAEAA